MVLPSLVLPAYNPTPHLLRLIHLLEQTSPDLKIIVVNDGSAAEGLAVLRQAETLGVEVLHHASRRGKGAALKTAFQHFLQYHDANSPGVITAHASGEHPAELILQILKVFMEYPQTFVIGARDILKLPRKNRFGNRLFRWLFSMAVGNQLQDPWSGLRAYPRDVLAELLSLPNDHYDFEAHVLLHACRKAWPYLELPCETDMALGAQSTPFNWVEDSMKIYMLFLKFAFEGMKS